MRGCSAVNNPEGNRLRGNGTLRVDTLGAAGATALYRNANNQIATCSSSERYKDAIEDLDLCMDALLQLRPVGYRWKDGGGGADVGFVAKEVARIDPRLVTRNDDGDIDGVRYDRLSAVLAAGFQTLHREQATLREDNAGQRTERATLRDRQQAMVQQQAVLHAELALLRERLLPAVAHGGQH